MVFEIAQCSQVCVITKETHSLSVLDPINFVFIHAVHHNHNVICWCSVLMPSDSEPGTMFYLLPKNMSCPLTLLTPGVVAYFLIYKCVINVSIFFQLFRYT